MSMAGRTPEGTVTETARASGTGSMLAAASVRGASCRRSSLARVVLSVAFASALVQLASGASGIDKGAHAQGDPIAGSCLSDNPYFATTRFPGWGSDDPAIVAFNDSDRPYWHWDLSDPPYSVLASSADVGSVFGLAYDVDSRHLYASAFLHLGFGDPLGPGGAGGVYRVSLDSGATELVASLDAGEGPWIVDDIAKHGLGDIDLAPNGRTLYVANLADGLIYRLDLPDGTVAGSFQHGASAEPWSANARLFGLGHHAGWLYHGVVDSREDPSLPGTLTGHVYRSRGDGSDMTEAVSFSLVPFGGGAWGDGEWRTSEPLITDIEFRSAGNPIIGVRDRGGFLNYAADRGGGIVPTLRAGETWLPTRFDDGSWSSSQGTLAAFPYSDSVVALTCEAGCLADTRAVWLDNSSGQISGPDNGHELLFGEAEYGGDLESLCGPDRAAHSIYLPAIPGIPTKCIGRRRAVDVILVLDMSTSMRSSTPSGRARFEAALDGASRFLGWLDFRPDASGSNDQVAVIGFNDSAWTEIGLADNFQALSAGLDRLPGRIAEGTRLDLAFEEAARQVPALGSPDGTRQPVVILMTDGHPNRVPYASDGTMESTIFDSAHKVYVKNELTLIYTIGVGSAAEVNEPLLRQLGWYEYHRAESAEALRRVYRRIAETIGCF